MKIVILAAIEEEILPRYFSNFELVYTGIGKINAAYTTSKVIYEKQPDYLVNVGTAGVLTSSLINQVCHISKVIERDALCEPLSPRGKFPNDSSPSEFSNELNFGYKLATGDSFVTSPDPWLLENSIDLVDMEYFSIAKVSHMHQIPCFSLKYGSDIANKDAARDWSLSFANASKALAQELDYFMGKISKK